MRNQLVNSHKPLYHCIESIVGRLYNSVCLLLIIRYKEKNAYKIFFHIFLKVVLVSCYQIWAIHTTLYRVCCIECTWLLVNAQLCAVLCISLSKCMFLAFKQFGSRKPTLLLKNIWKRIHNFFIHTIW